MIKAIVFDAYGTLYDVQSVSARIDAAFPGHGQYITQVWRLKQLEYTWLRTMMGRYEDFWAVTRDSLAYTLGTLGLEREPGFLDEMAESYNQLQPYPDAGEALTAMARHKLAILSNGSPDMLKALVRHSGLDHHFHAVISVDGKRAYKPDPRAYELVEETLGSPPDAVLFVSSNGFDIAGAKAFGFRVARIERLPSAALKAEIASAPAVSPLMMFKALRMQDEMLGRKQDHVVSSLLDLAKLVATLEAESD